MTNPESDSASFEALSRELLNSGLSLRFEARGASMSPCIRDGQIVHVTAVIVSKLRKGDIVLTKGHSGFRVHRLVVIDHSKNLFITRGDCGQQNDPPVRGDQILGIVVAKEVKLGKKFVRTNLKGIGGKLLQAAARAQFLTGKLVRRSFFGIPASLTILGLLLFAATRLNAQVAFDRTANLAANSYCTGSGTCSFTWAHQVGNASSNYILVVTASLNIKNSPSSSVSGITYNGLALTFQGAHNDAQSIMRTEIWTLLAPPTGANHNIVMVVDNPAAATIGVMAGSASFSGVDQTVPVGRYVANDGGNNANTGYSMLDVPSAVKGMVVDALATGGQTITIPAPENSIYTQQSNNQTSATNVYGAAAYEAGAPSVPMAETFTINAGEIPNWSESAISLNPSQADIGVSTTVTPVAPGTNSVYNITVYNNGPSAAAAVKLVDTLGTGTTYVSYTASSGVSCTDAGATLTCTVGALAPNVTATVALTVSTTAAGFYPNTAVVSDSGTPPDYNQGNNTYVAVAPVQTVVCATTNLTVGGTLSGVINTYYPGSATVAEGATSIPVGTATGAGATIASGTELLVMQMQNASINDSNNVDYGNGFTGQGFTAVNTAGNYEFVTATGPISGGAIPIHAAGPGGGLIFAYTSAAWSATAGASTYQVVVVPQYSSATLSSGLTALAWNGSTGGILAMDVAGTLTLGGATVDMDGKGFRGAAGLSLVGENGALDTDYEFAAPATYTTPPLNSIAITTGADGSKGEGIAGTPLWVQSGTSPLNTTSGYPSGTSGKDGSMGRGAPANAGGGATDGAPSAAGENNDNAGGGGGGNGGAGGFGGNTYGNNLSTGGEGGVAFPVTVNRFAMGGGGGAGSNNYYQDSQDSSGGAGGGMIFIRADSLSGTATLTANGIGAYTGTSSNAGGGGGAGGTIVVVTANGGETGLTLQANGGAGGGNEGCTACGTQTFLQGRIGPGAGGGGGAVYTSSVSGLPAISVTGGANGLTQDTTSTPIPYGATSGKAGVSVTNVALAQLTGLQSTALCTPDMTLGKSHVGNFTRGSTATYTIPVENVSPYGSTSGTVTVNDTLPVGLTPAGATGTNWTCSIASQTVSCINSTVLAPNSFYPSITVTANVLQTAPSTETNTALVSGGGEVNLANDSATDVANVVSIADLSITNTASPNPVAAGSNITFTQVLTNNGPSAADNTTLVEAVPTNTTFVSMAAPAGWTCTTPPVGSTGNVVCTDLSMAGGTAATFSLITKVNTGTANGTVITDTASASSSVSDPNSSNNTASASTIVGASAGAELTITNAASPNGIAAGGNITYTQILTNVGTLAATAASLTETVTPAPDVTFVSVSAAAAPGWTCTGPPVSCTNPSVAAGATATFTVVYQVNAGTVVGTTINNTATVTGTNQTSGPSTAIASDTVTASTSQADLALSTASTPLGVYAGNDITYIQTINNSGPSAATTVSFLEAVPTNTTFASVSAPAGWTCTTPAVGATGNVTCTDPSLAANTSAAIIVVVNVAPSITATPITATSSVSAANSLTSSTTTTTPVATACDLAVTNSGAPSPVAAGANITYTQVVTNSGPSNCSTAAFTESIPANTTFVSLTPVPAGWTCTTTGSISCSNPSVAPGSTSTFPVVVTVTAGTSAGTIITDTDTVTTTTRDTNLNNNSATVSIAVASATQADLSATNSASPNPVIAGSNITYTQTVTNGGPAAATAVSFTETLPANTTSVSLSGPGTWSCNLGTLTCTIASLAANSTATFTLVVKVNTNTASGATITQTDSVSSTTSDPNPGNNNASTSVQVADSADLSVTNTASPVPVQAGNNITYAQVVTNAGPSTAAVASLTETTPANTTYQSIVIAAGWSCTTPVVGGTGTITCTNPSVATGSASFTVVLKVTAGTPAGTAINNTAIVSSSTSDPNPGNNGATAADIVATATLADLITTNIAAPTSVAAGSNVTYTQSVTNNGPAAATSVSFTQTTPPNTNFQSITIPGGWTCTNPAVGAAGVITCTIATLAVNATGNFTVVLQVNAGTASGTNIAETATATATNIVPNLTSNTAIATVVVANANSANVTIVKTATPSPNVPSGDTLTYTLAVTNNGPASATNVTVTDPLPADVMYLSVNTTVGTCSEADGTVTCLLGTMANASTASIAILTLAGAPGTATNTASVIADQMTSPNTSTQVETITAATSIKLESFAAQIGRDKTGASRVALLWKTGGEVHNLGFNVYREQDGERVQLNPSLIAGSALLMSGALPKHSGKTYTWIDSSTGAGTGSYWLEDVDVNGTRVLHGPISATSSTSNQVAGDATPASSAMLNQLNQARPAPTFLELSHRVESISPNTPPTLAQHLKQFDIAAHSAVKIFAKHEGWYRVTQPELIAAGLDPNVDPALLHLYAEAIEQPMQIIGASAGPGGFGPQAEIYFYGTGIDTQYSGTRVYFLTTGQSPGERIQQLPPSTGSNQPPASFPFTVELTPHTTYFSALTTAKGNNFFGPLISSTPVDETIQVSHLDATSTEPAQFDVILQGIILAVPHDVAITLNGSTLGDLTFSGQGKGRFHVTLPSGLLQEGTNTITFTSQDGEYDYSLVQSIHVTYPHLYVADSDELIFTGRPGDQLKLTGFSQASVAVLDITNPNQPIQLTPQIATVSASKSDYALEVQVPWSTTNPAAPAQHTLMAVADAQVSSAAGIRQNHPSHWHSAQPGSEIVMVSPEAFAGALAPVLRAHQAEGKSSAIVLVDELYDEFNFGQHSPLAIRDFLQTAVKVWHTAPHFLLLNGRASLDPRNYLGFGYLDFFPTKIIPTTGLMTASDDWFSDFNDSGLPTIATGRLPVSTAAEAQLVAGKVATYEGQSTNGPWTSQALMVADMPDTENFTKYSQVVQAQLPSSIQATDVFLSDMSIPQAQQAILNSINSGQLLVNYSGHGSEDEWSGDNLFNGTEASTLTNGSSLPVFLIMDCLNGFFQDVYEEPLAVSLMLAPNGGAVAVLASSGLNQATPQTILDKLVVQAATGPAQLALGDAILKAKSGITDLAVRKTYNLLGDPAMKIKPPVASPTH
ncbi:MAG: C25 family cysteine peptidase [Candidatus Sulfotelmatobacter sp.]